jgi:hypothetical protein
MRKQTLFFVLILVSAMVMVMPASAKEITISFDDGRVAAGQTLVP